MKKLPSLLPLWQKTKSLPQKTAEFALQAGKTVRCRWQNFRMHETVYLAPVNNFKYNKAVWFVLMLMAWFMLDLLLHYWRYLQEIFTGNLVLALPTALLSLALWVFLLYFLFNDICGIVSLHRRQEIQKEVFEYIESKNVPALKKCLLTTVENHGGCRQQLEEKWENLSVLSDVLDTYQQTVLAERDCKADFVILKYAALAGGANVVSSKAVLDFIITQLLYSKMVVEIARVYGIRLGICSFCKLMVLGVVGAFFSGIITGIIEKFIHRMFARITGEAVSSALIMAQLGFRIKFALRPVVPEKTGYLVNNIRRILQDIKNRSKQEGGAE